MNGSSIDGRNNPSRPPETSFTTLYMLCRLIPQRRAMRATGMPFSLSCRMLMLASRDITEMTSPPWFFTETKGTREAPR